MSEIREKLCPYLGKRIKIRGQLSEVRHDHNGTRVCITDPEVDGEVICEHVWVIRCAHWREMEEQTGSEVEFTAIVTSYCDVRNDGSRNFCLASPDDLVVKQLPRLPIPNLARPPRQDQPPVSLPSSVEDDEPLLESRKAGSAIEDVRRVKKLAKEFGGIAQVSRFLVALEEAAMPLDELKELIAVLGEE